MKWLSHAELFGRQRFRQSLDGEQYGYHVIHFDLFRCVRKREQFIRAGGD